MAALRGNPETSTGNSVQFVQGVRVRSVARDPDDGTHLYAGGGQGSQMLAAGGPSRGNVDAGVVVQKLREAVMQVVAQE